MKLSAQGKEKGVNGKKKNILKRGNKSMKLGKKNDLITECCQLCFKNLIP